MDSCDIVRLGAPPLANTDHWYRIVEQPYGFFIIEIRTLNDFFGSRRLGQAQSYPNETMADITAVALRAIARLS